jgi:hypothetical protein
LVIGLSQQYKQNPVVFNVTGYGTITANFKGNFDETFIVSRSMGLVSTITG